MRWQVSRSLKASDSGTTRGTYVTTREAKVGGEGPQQQDAGKGRATRIYIKVGRRGPLVVGNQVYGKVGRRGAVKCQQRSMPQRV